MDLANDLRSKDKVKTASTLSLCSETEAAGTPGQEAVVRRDRPQLASRFRPSASRPQSPLPFICPHTGKASVRQPPRPYLFSPQLQECLSHPYSLPAPGARDTLSQHTVPCCGSNAGSEHMAWLPCYFLVINLSLLVHKNPSPFFIHCFPLSPDLRSRIPVIHW